MDRVRIVYDKEKIVSKRRYVLDQIVPMHIKKMDGDNYSVLFKATQSCTEKNVFIYILLKYSNEFERRFFDYYPLNINNIAKNAQRLAMHDEMLEDMEDTNTYACDFNMKEYEENKQFFITSGGRIIDDKSHIDIADFLITRDNFIKLNLFFTRLMMMNPNIAAETAFLDKKFTNIEFVTITDVKLNASSLSDNTLVCSNYECGHGPTRFKLNFITPRSEDKKLRNPLLGDLFNVFYSQDFIINDMVYEPNADKLYVIYESKNLITNKYNGTKALIFTKEYYDKTNFLNLNNIYEKEN